MFQAALAFFILMAAAVLGPTLYNIAAASAYVDQRAEEQRRLDAVEDALIAEIGDKSGDEPTAPAPSQAGTYAQAPVAGAGGDHPFLYCPYGSDPSAIRGDKVRQVNGTFYRVAVSAGRVVGSDPPPAALVAAGVQPLAILIAPRGAATPSCSAVTLAGGRFFVEGGSVRVVTSARVRMASRAAELASYTIWVSPTGNGDGLSPSSPASWSYETAERFWDSQALAVTVRMADGDYSDISLTTGGAVGDAARVTFSSSDGDDTNGRPRLLFNPATVAATVSLVGVDVDAAVRAAGRTLYISNSNIGCLTVPSGRDVYLLDSVRVSSSAGYCTSVEVGGRLFVSGTATLDHQLSILPGGFADIRGTFSATAADTIVDGGSVVVRGTFRGRLQNVAGSLALYGGVVTAVGSDNSYDFAVRMTGGRLELVGGQIVMAHGSALALSGGTDVVSDNALLSGSDRALFLGDDALVSGTATLRAAKCWDDSGGALAAPASGRYLAVSADEAIVDPTPLTPLSSADLTENGTLLRLFDRNADRARLRGHLAGSWSCS